MLVAHPDRPRGGRGRVRACRRRSRSIAGCSPTGNGMPAPTRACMSSTSASRRTRRRSIRDDFADLYDRADKLTFVSDDRALLKSWPTAPSRRSATARRSARARPIISTSPTPPRTRATASRRSPKMLGVDLADVAVFGDMDNDVAMFDRAGLLGRDGPGARRGEGQGRLRFRAATRKTASRTRSTRSFCRR